MKLEGLLLSLFVFSQSLQQCDAANHYCVDGFTATLRMDDFYHRDETIIPRVSDETLRQHQPKSCKVEVELKTRKPDRQLVLMAVPSADSQRPSAKIIIELKQDELKYSVDKGMFRVLAVNQQKNFGVESSCNPRERDPSSENLRIVLPLPGECNRDMLGFNGSCYTLSAVEQNATEALHSIGGDAQLASFSSMAEIRQFVAANSARLNRLPYEKPLRLGQPVRLGIFLNKADASVLSAVRSESGCQLRPVLNPDEFRQGSPETGPCLSLRVNESDGVQLEFDDCSRLMLSLLSFPDTARSPRRALWSGAELAKKLEQLQSHWCETCTSPMQAVEKTSKSSIGANQAESNKILMPVIVTISSVAFVGASLLLLWELKKRRSKNMRPQSAVIALWSSSRQVSKGSRSDENEKAGTPETAELSSLLEENQQNIDIKSRKMGVKDHVNLETETTRL